MTGVSTTPPPPTERGAAGATRRMGRPPLISRDQIAEAALEVGLSDLTLRAVADHLGVTTTALYHHISGRDELVQLAAERSARRLRTPTDVDQHWAMWLMQWAVHTRTAFVGDPALLDQFLDGVISPESVLHNVEAILDLLVRQGFSAADALRSFELVSTCALGSALGDVRDRRSVESGRGSRREALRSLTAEDERDLPLLRTTGVDEVDVEEEARAQFRAVILGIAALRGDDLDEIATALDAPPPVG